MQPRQNHLLPTEFQCLAQDEQEIARLIAARLGVPMSKVFAAIVGTERGTKLASVKGLALQECEAFQDKMKISQGEAERILQENLLHCAADEDQ